MSAEGGKIEDGSDLFCVSAPARNRLRIIANSAAQMHLAVLVRKARSAAVVAEGIAGVAMMSLAAAATAGRNAVAPTSRRRTREAGEGEEHGSGSESSGTEDTRSRFTSFDSEAAW